MKSYTITVNGTAYEVTVEENGNAAAPVAGAAPKAAATCHQRQLLQQHRKQQLLLQAQVLLKFPQPFLEKL